MVGVPQHSVQADSGLWGTTCLRFDARLRRRPNARAFNARLRWMLSIASAGVGEDVGRGLLDDLHRSQ
jgi:hypothetical protein